MKKLFVWMLTLVICLSFCACGANRNPESTTGPVADEPSLTTEQLKILDVVESTVNSGTFNREEIYKEFMGVPHTLHQVTNVTHYENENFNGAKMDCYLVTVSSVACWEDGEPKEDAAEKLTYFYVDTNTEVSFDGVATELLNAQEDTATEQGRATYLMRLYADAQNGAFAGPYVNESETVTEMTAEEVAAINAALNKE